jgi:hypothetical protein
LESKFDRLILDEHQVAYLGKMALSAQVKRGYNFDDNIPFFVHFSCYSVNSSLVFDHIYHFSLRTSGSDPDPQFFSSRPVNRRRAFAGCSYPHSKQPFLLPQRISPDFAKDLNKQLKLMAPALFSYLLD